MPNQNASVRLGRAIRQIRDEAGISQITVTASVDSENGFGASLRSPYVCTVTKSGSQWLLKNLDLQEGG